MQGVEYITGAKEIQYRNSVWLGARDCMIRKAKTLNDKCSYPNNDFDSSYEYGGVTKQLCNRLIEPFMWLTTLVTATEWENFFNLRRHPDAEIHIQALAESMWDAMNESTPKELKTGEWHVPFGDRMQIPVELTAKYWGIGKVPFSGEVNEVLKVMIATARCARLSYMTFDGEIDYEKDIKLHDQLLENKHASPMEHCAIAKGDGLFYANFNSWQSYRNLLEL